MELSDLLAKITKPDELVDPRLIDSLLFWISSYITEAENELQELDYKVAFTRLDLIKEHGSVAKADAFLKVTDAYKEQKTLEHRIRTLKAFKANLRRRFDLLTGNFR